MASTAVREILSRRFGNILKGNDASQGARRYRKFGKSANLDLKPHVLSQFKENPASNPLIFWIHTLGPTVSFRGREIEAWPFTVCGTSQLSTSLWTRFPKTHLPNEC